MDRAKKHAYHERTGRVERSAWKRALVMASANVLTFGELGREPTCQDFGSEELPDIFECGFRDFIPRVTRTSILAFLTGGDTTRFWFDQVYGLSDDRSETFERTKQLLRRS